LLRYLYDSIFNPRNTKGDGDHSMNRYTVY